MNKERDKKATTLNKGNEPSSELIKILENAPKGVFELTKEDRQFLNSTVGREVID